jgi:hypothetical protein
MANPKNYVLNGLDSTFKTVEKPIDEVFDDFKSQIDKTFKVFTISRRNCIIPHVGNKFLKIDFC